MAKRFTQIFFIVLAIALFLAVGFLLVLFLAPGFEIFGLRYISIGARKFDSGLISITDEIGDSFNGSITLTTKEVPVYVYYTEQSSYFVRYYEDYSGLTTTNIEEPSLKITKDTKSGGAVIEIEEFEKFIFENANTKKYLDIYIPIAKVNVGSGAYNTNLNLNLGKSSIKFDKNFEEEPVRYPTHRNINLKTNGAVELNIKVSAKKFTYETKNSIVIGEDEKTNINAEDYTLNSGGKIVVARKVTGDIDATTKNGNIKIVGARNLYASSSHGSVSAYEKDKDLDLYGIAKITTKTGNVTLGKVNGSGTSEITTTSGNVTIQKILNAKVTTKRGFVSINSVSSAEIETNVGKVNVEESLSKLKVTTKRGNITVGGEGMTMNNIDLFSRIGRINIGSASGSVKAETISSDITFVNGSSSNISLNSGKKLTATGLQGKVNIYSTNNATLRFNKISGNTKIEVSDKCKSLIIHAHNDIMNDTRYVISGKSVVLYEDDETDDIEAFKILEGTVFTNKKDSSGALLDVTGNNVNIVVYFKKVDESA